MTSSIRSLLISSAMLAMLGPASALPLAPLPPQSAATLAQPAAADLLCGRGWHYNWFFLRCERNPHICPAGQFWVSMLRVCM